MQIITPLLALLALQTAQPTDDAAVRLGKALAASSWTYSRPEGSTAYFVDFKVNDTKNRRVFVQASATELLSFRSHAIYTTVWVGSTLPNASIIDYTFAKPKKLGHFYIYKDAKGVYALRFGVQYESSDLLADPKADDPAVIRLRDTISFVNQVGQEVAEQVEKVLAKGG